MTPQGNVVETKLLQGIGYGIEQKVLAVLQRWHFRPALRTASPSPRSTSCTSTIPARSPVAFALAAVADPFVTQITAGRDNYTAPLQAAPLYLT